ERRWSERCWWRRRVEWRRRRAPRRRVRSRDASGARSATSGRTIATSCATGARSTRTSATFAPTSATYDRTCARASTEKRAAICATSTATMSTRVAISATSRPTGATFVRTAASCTGSSSSGRRRRSGRRAVGDRFGGVRGFGRRFGCGLHPAAQHFRHAPRLRDAAAGRVRGRRVEDLADRAEAERAERADASLEKAPRAGSIAGVHLEPGVDPRADQPRPDRALVVRRVARPQIAEIAFFVLRLARRQRAQADRGEQPLAHDVEHRVPARPLEYRMVERDGEDLVRPAERAVALLPVHDVIEVAAIGHPETLIE